jgi:hypothetical protein
LPGGRERVRQGVMGERGRDVSEKKIEIRNRKKAEGRRRESGHSKKGR